MIETHPFGPFIPPQAKYFALGSFTTKEAYDEAKKANYHWFYSNGRNQFWPILEAVYSRSLRSRPEMERLFTDLGMALGDIIYQCERVKNSNLDVNLTNIVYAHDDVARVLATGTITKIYFTSRFVENRFRIEFKSLIAQYPTLEYVTLPSPSPRYAQMTRAEKVARYSELLPKLPTR